MLPYFDGCDENLSEYMEDFEMMKNKDLLLYVPDIGDRRDIYS